MKRHSSLEIPRVLGAVWQEQGSKKKYFLLCHSITFPLINFHLNNFTFQLQNFYLVLFYNFSVFCTNFVFFLLLSFSVLPKFFMVPDHAMLTFVFRFLYILEYSPFVWINFIHISNISSCHFLMETFLDSHKSVVSMEVIIRFFLSLFQHLSYHTIIAYVLIFVSKQTIKFMRSGTVIMSNL